MARLASVLPIAPPRKIPSDVTVGDFILPAGFFIWWHLIHTKILCSQEAWFKWISTRSTVRRRSGLIQKISDPRDSWGMELWSRFSWWDSSIRENFLYILERVAPTLFVWKEKMYRGACSQEYNLLDVCQFYEEFLCNKVPQTPSALWRPHWRIDDWTSTVLCYDQEKKLINIKIKIVFMKHFLL